MGKHIRKIIAVMTMLIMMMAFVACEKKEDKKSKEEVEKTEEVESTEDNSTTEETKDATNEIVPDEKIDEGAIKYVVENIDNASSWVDAKAKTGNLKSEKVYERKLDYETGNIESVFLKEILYSEKGDIVEIIIHNQELSDEYDEKTKEIVRNSEIVTRLEEGDDSENNCVVYYESGEYVDYEYSIVVEEDMGDVFEISVKEYDKDKTFIKRTVYTYTYDTLTSSKVSWEEYDFNENIYLESVYTYYRIAQNVVLQEEVEDVLKNKTVVQYKYEGKEMVNKLEDVSYDKEGNIIDKHVNEELLSEYNNRNLELVKSNTDIVDTKIERENRGYKYTIYYDSGDYVVYEYSIHDAVIMDVTYKDRESVLGESYYDKDGTFIKGTFHYYTYNVLNETYEYYGEDGWLNDYVYTKYTYYGENYDVESDWFGNVIHKDDEVYVEVDMDYKFMEEYLTYVYGEDKYQKLLESIEKHQVYNLDGYGELKGVKLDVLDVKKIAFNHYGQDVSDDSPEYGIFILHNDNTVSFCSWESLIEGTNEVVKLNKNNVVDIISITNNTYFVYADDSMENARGEIEND